MINSPRSDFGRQAGRVASRIFLLAAAAVVGWSLAAAAQTAPPACDLPPAGIVAWWAAEGEANDSVGTNNGSLQGGAVYASGEVGQAFSLNGTSAYVVVPASPSLNVGSGGGLTIEGWINSPTITAQQILVEWHHTGTPSFGLHMQTGTGSGGGASAGALYANLVDTSGIYHFIWSNPGLLVSNQFQHVALTYNMSTGVGTLYVDGSVVSQSNLGVFTPQTSYDVYLGERPGWALDYAGLLDEMSVYNRALASNEIAAIYQAGSAGKCRSIPPEIISQPTNQTVVLGDTATFNVSASGAPPLNYQWSFDGVNIANATNLSLTLTNVQLPQAGNYSVLVTNLYGFAASSNAVLAVNSSPACDSAPAGLVSWWPAEGNANDIVSGNNGTLMGGGFANGEVGQAFVFSGNGQLVTVGNPANLQLQNFTIEAWIGRANTSVVSYGTAGNGIIFGYGYGGYGLYLDASGVPTLSQIGLSQTKPSGAITDTNYHHVAVTKSGSTVIFYIDGIAYSAPAYSPSFTFTTVAAIGARGDNLDNGFYGLIDEASVYSRALTPAEVLAIYEAASAGKCPPMPTAPAISLQPTNLAVNAGNTASFSVSASGTPPLSYQWSFNGTNIANGTNLSLTLTNVQFSQAGSYSVVVTNQYGSITSSNATMNVFAIPPFISSQPGNQWAYAGTTANFKVSAGGTLPLAYQWNWNGTNLNGATNSLLTLTNVQLPVAGNYSVLVTNMAGAQSSSNAVLTVVPIPTNMPVITSFAPSSGYMGASVAIVGSGFSSVATNNVVYFGAARAMVNEASATNLVVMVPTGATYAPVTETVNGLTASASGFFLPTFLSGGVLSSASFASQVILRSGSNPSQVVIADLDGDGKPDLVVGNSGDGSIWVYRNIGTNGTLAAASFAAPVILATGAGGSLYGLAVGDLDGDGRLDIVTANWSRNTLSIFQNESLPGVLTTNSFAALVNLPVPGTPAAVAIGDLDGDGRPEIVVADNSGNTVSVLQNQSLPGLLTSNSFAALVNFIVGPSPFRVALADLDEDGRLDVVTVNEGSVARRVSVLRNISTLGRLSTNSLATAVNLAGTDQGNLLAIGDLDGDGRLDLATGSFAGRLLDGYRNLSTPGILTSTSFGPEISFGVSNLVENVALGDLDGEGKLAVALVTQGASQLRLYRNLSQPGSFTNGSLGSPIIMASGNNPAVLAIGDLDGDGRPDLVVVNQSDGTLSLYHNMTPPGGPPVINVQPINRLVAVGGRAVFSVAASGSIPMSFQWSFNGTNLVNATNAALTLTDVQFSQAGDYGVTASNASGSAASSNAVLTVVATMPCDPAPPGLVSWWPAEGNANDIISGNNGSLIGSGYASGEVGQAFVFNGSEQLVTVGNPANLQLQSFTIEAWVQRASPSVVSHGTAGNGIIFGYGSGGYGLYLDASGVPTLSQIGTGQTKPSVAITDTNFHHLAVTKSGSAVVFYVDGVDYSAPAYDPNFTFSTVAAIGARGDNLDNSFIGSIDETSVYSRALTAAEVLAIYEAGSSGKCPPNLPLLVSQPTNQVVATGQSVNLSVTAAGTGFTYQWQFNTSDISGATNANYYIASATTNDSGIYDVVVSDSGGSSTSSNATLIVLPPARTGTGAATLTGGFVTGVAITDGGSGYTNIPLIRLIGGGGSGAEAFAVISNGTIFSITITNAGFGYTNAPQVVIDPPLIFNPVLGIAPMSFLSFSNLTVGGTYQLQQSVQWYWTNQFSSFTATNALYTQIVGGANANYRLALNPVPTQAFATAELFNDFVVGAIITSGGSGYVTSPAVSIVGGGGFGAEADATISGGVVASITFTNAGMGYTNPPTIQIAPPPAAAVSPTVYPVMRVDSANLAPYDNYQIQFLTVISGSWTNWNGGLFTPAAATNSQFIFITNAAGFFRVQSVP